MSANTEFIVGKTYSMKHDRARPFTILAAFPRSKGLWAVICKYTTDELNPLAATLHPSDCVEVVPQRKWEMVTEYRAPRTGERFFMNDHAPDARGDVATAGFGFDRDRHVIVSVREIT